MNIGTDLPKDHVTQKGCLIGITGTGKSNGVGVILDVYHKNDLPYVILDVAGAHWGQAEKYSCYIIAGEKGTPATPDQGGIIAEQIVNNNLKHVIIDMSHWDDEEIQKFTTDFLRMIRGLHKLKRTPRHIFIEEAEVVCPQVNFLESKFSLRECNNVMKRGRSVGLGMTLISQRPQDVNKRALSQCQCSFFLHLESNKDLDVVREMIKNEDIDTRKDLIRYVEKAQKGECLLYSPQWLRGNRKFKFPLREAFHAGYTPEVGKVVVEPTNLKIQHMNIAIPVTKVTEKENEEEELKKGISDARILIYALIFGVFMYVMSVAI